MKKKIFLLFILTQTVIFAEKTVLLPETNIQSDYLEINQMKNSKQIFVIEKKQIEEKGYSSVSSILQDIPSIQVGNTSWGSIDIRGQGEDKADKNLQVLIDGAPITNLINHPLTTNYDIVPVENIEKIEVIPGGGSIIYGSGTAGGVINITTNLSRLNTPQNSIDVSVGNSEKKYTLSLGHKIHDNINFQISYLRKNKDLYFKNTYRNSDYFSTGLYFDLTKKQQLSLRYSKLMEDGKFVRNINYVSLEKEGKNYIPKTSKTTVGLDKFGHKIEKNIDGYSDATRRFDNINLNYRYSPTPDIKYLLNTFYSKGNFSNSNLDDLTMFHHTYGIKNKLHIKYGNNTSLKGSQILFGFDAYQQDAKLEYDDYQLVSWVKKTYKIRPLSFKYKKKTLAFYFLNTLKYNKWETSQGIRRDLTYWHFDKVANKNEGKDTSHRHNTNYEMSLAYHYRQTGMIYGRYEKGFTSPGGLEITDDFSKQNIKITNGEDEIYDLYEIGWKDYIGFSTVNVVAFYSKTENEMSRNYVISPSLGFGRKTINILKTERKGLELNFSQKFGKLELKESYSYLKGKRNYNGKESKFVKPGSYIDWSNSGLKKVPKHSFTLEANYHFTPRFFAGLRYKYTGKYSNFSSIKEKEEEGYIKSHSVTDLSLHYHHENGISLYGGINNIFNEKYFEYVGTKRFTVTPAEERTYYLGIKYKF